MAWRDWGIFGVEWRTVAEFERCYTAARRIPMSRRYRTESAGGVRRGLRENKRFK